MRRGGRGIVTIPRDTWVPIPDSAYEDRIGTLYGTGGAPLVVRATERLLGVPVHQYVAVDMQTCADIIDLLGGIDLYVESDMDYDDPEADLSIHLKQGYQHLDGKQAQEYLRYRGTDLGDVGRSERQQQFVKALYEEVMRVRTLTKPPRHRRAPTDARRDERGDFRLGASRERSAADEPYGA